MVDLSPVVGEFVGTFILIVLGNGVVQFSQGLLSAPL